MSDLRYGLVGCGMMGQEHIRNVALLDGVQVAAFYEPDAAMAAATETLVPEAARAATVDALLEMPGLDALIVASPNDVHLDQLETIAARRPLPLLIEKPLYTDPADAARVAQVIQRYPAPVWVAMEYRYMPAITAFLEEAEGITGGVQMLTIREHRYPFLHKVDAWNRFNARSGGTMVEKCCHFFDLMRLVFRSDPVGVMASGGQALNHRDEAYDGAVPDVWDNAYAIVDFPGGRRAMLELCMFAEGSDYQEEITAVGPAGKIEARIPGPTRFWPESRGPVPVAELVISPRAPEGRARRAIPVDPALLDAGDHNGSTFYQHQRFAAMLRDGGAPEVSLADGAWAVAMGHAAQRSALSARAETVTGPVSTPAQISASL